MSTFLVLGIYLLILLSGDSEGAGWIRFFHGGSVENEGDNYGVNNFLGMMTWKLFFLNGDIEEEMMSPPWINFLRSVLHFVVVRSGHDEGIGRISFRLVFLILLWQKEGRHKKVLAIVRWTAVLRPYAECFACAVIHTKCHIGLDLRFGAIHNVGTI